MEVAGVLVEPLCVALPPTGLKVRRIVVLFCKTLFICIFCDAVPGFERDVEALLGAVFFKAVREILGDNSFNCFDMLVVPGGEDVGIICISDVEDF